MANLRTEEFIKGATNTIAKLLYAEFEPSIPDYMNKESFLYTLVGLVEFEVVAELHYHPRDAFDVSTTVIVIDFGDSTVPLQPPERINCGDGTVVADGWLDNEGWMWRLRTYA
jgi:hypothetical protein